MEVTVNGNEVRIKGKNCSEKWYLKIYVDESDGRDRYSLDTIKPPFEIGNLPTVLMTPDHIILRDHGIDKIIES